MYAESLFLFLHMGDELGCRFFEHPAAKKLHKTRTPCESE